MDSIEANENEKFRIELEGRIQSFVDGLQSKVDDYVAKKSVFERRWVEDLRLFHGRYDQKTENELKDANRSTLFVNITRPNTMTWVARLTDLLFPTDDKNWGIRPTPVPELMEMAKMEISRVPEDRQQEARVAMDDALAQMEEANKRADAMEREISDQFKQGRYQAKARNSIETMCKLGPAVMKGPIDMGKSRLSWASVTDEETGETFNVRVMAEQATPVYVSVNPFHFFPDPYASDIEDAEDTFERHYLTARQLRKWTKTMGIDPEKVSELIREKATESLPPWYADLQTITEESGTSANGGQRYCVWEYRGAVTASQFRDLMMQKDDAAGLDLYEEYDDLDEVEVVIYFCHGKVLKFGIHHLDSEEPLYSVANFIKDETSIWGRGVPDIIRAPQEALNSAWRALMSNVGMSVGPQIVIDEQSVRPADNEWKMTPHKIWLRTPDATSQTPFQIINIPSHQGELINVINMAKAFADEESSLPPIAKGEGGARVAPTYSGMAMIMNNANVIFRHAVKNWDDNMTVPNLRRIYDWNMQFNQKSQIHGDMEVDARGSSVLLVREVQSQNFMVLVRDLTAHPAVGPMIKGLDALRQTVKSMQLPADEIVMSDEEWENYLQKQAEQGEGDPVEAEFQLKMALMQAEKKMDFDLRKIEMEGKMFLAERDREIKMMTLAAQREIKLEELQAMLINADEERAFKDRIQAAEFGYKRQERMREGQPVAGSRYSV